MLLAEKDPKVIPRNEYTLGCDFDSAQPPRVERSRNPVDGYLLSQESPNPYPLLSK